MIPLAERMRPKKLNEYIGQKHIVGEGAVIRQMIESGNLSSFILWGPPGVGKTTLARIIANELDRPFFTLSAVTSGVKDVRDIIDKAKHSLAIMHNSMFGNTDNPILFIDEIHRFSKSQQDSLLGAVEDGTITLIGATTENPSFEVISPLLSRCAVYVLKPLTKNELQELTDRVLREDDLLKNRKITVLQNASLFRYSGGDARKLLNILELVVNTSDQKNKANGMEQSDIVIDDKIVTECLQQNPLTYDKDGEMHYDIISAFIKSIRGSDPDAAIYWLARMVAAGEDPQFIARRLIISASEDIGLANPNALLVANTAFEAVSKIGWPEARIPLAMVTVYLATSQKSNSAYLAVDNALKVIKESGNLSVPLHLRNAPTQLLEELGYGENYQYAHDFPNHFINQQYLPDELKDYRFWYAQGSPAETKMSEWMQHLWRKDRPSNN